MHSRAFGLVPELNGMAYGFYEESRNGHRIIGHGGDTQWFHSDMHLMLDDHIGFFISYNSAGKPGFSGTYRAVAGFPGSLLPLHAAAGAAGCAMRRRTRSRSVGNYWLSRRSATNIAAVTSALDQVEVTENADGTISLDRVKDLAGNPKHFKEIAPLLFRDVDGQSHIAFIKDYAGRQIIVTDLPIFVFQPVPQLKNQNLNLAVLVFAVVILAADAAVLAD